MMRSSKASRNPKAQESPELVDEATEATGESSPPATQDDVYEAGDAELGKVRELLFGAHMRETRVEIARLQERLGAEATRFRADLDEQLAGMGRLVHERSEAAMEKIQSESTARQIGDEAVIRKLEEVREHLESKLDTMIERANKAERELRDQLLSQCKLLSYAITQKHEEAVNLLTDGMAEMKATKLDRASVADLFKELAGRLDSSDV